jgi:glycosyltransferase involved in cell wall biosynthesis
MKILMTAESYYPFLDKGGPAVKIRAIALGLARLGHRVTVLTSDWGFQPSLVSPAISSEKVRFGWRMQESGVEALFLPSIANYRTVSVNPRVLAFAGRVREYDVVHIYGLYDLLGPAVTLFCRRNHIPYVVEPMGMFRPIIRNLLLKNVYHVALGNRLLRSARLLIATSDQEKNEMVDGGTNPQRVVVRRNGVELPSVIPARGSFRKQVGIPSDARVVLYLGRLEAKKSPELLVAAFARWRKKSESNTPSFLAIAGPEHERGYVDRLNSLASSLGIREELTFTGPLYDEAKWSAYRDADVFVLPSQNENFGNSAAEAVACGTPVIVTERCGIAPYIAQRTGLVVAHDEEAIARALAEILDRPERAARFRSACPTAAKELSWDEPICQMVRIYERALSGAVTA